jgi:hypothetical protein
MLKSPCEITLRFKIVADKGAPLDYEQAERLLDIRKPAKVWKAGDPLSRSQQHRAMQYDTVSYMLEWSLVDWKLPVHIERVLKHLEHRGPAAKDFLKSYSCELSLTLILYYRGRNAPMEVPWMHISVDVARRLAELGVEIDMDLYLSSNDEQRRADNAVIDRN